MWNGTVCFGLLRIPVKLYSATESRTIRFREVHLKDGSRLEHRRICSEEQAEVDYSEVVKGYEVREGRYVVLGKDEIKAAAGDRGKVIEISEFVEASEIDPVFVERTYYLGPRDEPQAWALLRETLGRSGRAGIGRFSFHNREYLAAMRSRDGLIALETLRFHDEIVRGKDLKVKAPSRSPTPEEGQMADRLIAGLEVDFEPGDYRDRHRDAVMDLIAAKADGREPVKTERIEDEATSDLTAALEASLAATKDGPT